MVIDSINRRVPVCMQAAPFSGRVATPGSSVPGRIRFIPGGVARNIAHSLLLLAASEGRPSPVLLSAVGDDDAGKALLHHWKSLGGDIRAIYVIEGAMTPTVSIIFGSTGDVAASVADVAMLETELSQHRIAAHAETFKAAKVVLIDGDMSKCAIEVRFSVHSRQSTQLFF